MLTAGFSEIPRLDRLRDRRFLCCDCSILYNPFCFCDKITKRARRGFIRQYPLRKHFFANTAKKSLWQAHPYHSDFSYLCIKILLSKCFAVLPLEFLFVARNRFAEILGVFQKVIPKLQAKRLRQNRTLSYETPPNVHSSFLLSHVTYPDLHQQG